MARMSARNLERAQAYREDELRARRRDFYRILRERIEAWLEREGVPRETQVALEIGPQFEHGVRSGSHGQITRLLCNSAIVASS